ncbi:glycosyltransferase family 1 protein [Atopobacter sp. AH10]|uniref:glycosyltransferase n=1 Tax=Atopobacter sp. AH10 TaxID=2315861 RepID=UPI000EF17FBA|nr:glycosyltransferase [Atopobacter sp. AH10]RLK63791.1 glycosyltransferase family 1 protein [Atopobacter sp. AH10]
MNLLFLGSIYKNSDENKLIEENPGGIGIASNTLQVNLLNALNLYDVNTEVISSLPVGNFPNLSRSFLYNKKKYLLFDKIPVNQLLTVNTYLIKHFIREKVAKKIVKNWIRKNSKDSVIMIYDLYMPYLNLIPFIKECNPNIPIVIFIPDLIGKLRNDTGNSKLINLFLKSRENKCLDLVNFADAYIFVSDLMKEQVNVSVKPYITIHGIVNDQLQQKEIGNIKNKLIFLYSGLLSKQYNVDKLVDYFIHDNSNTNELWICGSGELSDYIKYTAVNNPNIRYFGLVSKKQANDLELMADVCVNPRPNRGIYTRYSFPSKNLEYLNKGKSVICYKLPPFKDTFDNCFSYITNEMSLENWIDYNAKISTEELHNIGSSNRSFVQKTFGIDSQGNRILAFLNNLIY